MPRPRGGDWLRGEIASLKNSGVTDLVSMLMPTEEAQLDLKSEQLFCEELGLRFHRHPIVDRGIPTQPAFDKLIDSLVPVMEQGGFVAVHCRAGIGRATITAAALLCRLGISPDDAMTLISQARGFDVPDTEKQLDFIVQFGQRAR